jgi:DNA modification methylase
MILWMIMMRHSEPQLTLIAGDCRAALGEFTAQADLLFTDPPYNISNNRNSNGASRKFSGYSSNKGAWDTECPAEQWVPLAVNALKPGGMFLCFGVFGSLVPIFEQLLDCGMTFQSHIVWHKSNPAPSIHRRMLTHANEIILTFSKGPRWYFDYQYAKSLNNGHQHHNVFTVPAVRKVMGVTRKPPTLCLHLIQLFCPHGGTVLDPFAGTGAIPATALHSGRNAIAIERNQRLVKYMAQPALFV